MKISQRIQSVQPSMTLALTARAKALKAQGVDVISFGSGEPDFDTPDVVKERAIEELRAGNTKYAPASGTPALKQAVADKLRRDQGLDYAPEQIIINCGAKHSCYNIFMTLLDDGDEVILPAPYWLTYPEQIAMAGGRSVVLETGAAQGFKITPEQLEGALTDRTVALLLNSPNNPSGIVYTREELEALAAVLERHPKVVVISDEIYEKMVYGGATHVSPAQLSDAMRERTLIVNGMSKAYAMTGWRLGWVAGPKPFIKAMGNLQSHSTSNPVSFCMPAGITALEECEEEATRRCEVFDTRRREIVSLLNAIDGVHCPEPMGAFYVFPDVSKCYKRLGVASSLEFCEKMLDEVRVACVPGAPFGDDACIRLSYAVSMDAIRTGVGRLAERIAQGG